MPRIDQIKTLDFVASDLKWLDVGIGTSQLIEKLERKNIPIEIHGVDVSKKFELTHAKIERIFW